MKKKDLLFIAGAAFVVAALYILSITGTKPPYVPRDAAHAASTDKEQCKECHGKDKVSPMKQGHPFKDDCFKCHERQKGEAG